MYVSISGYKIKEGEYTTFVEMVDLEQKMNATPAGMSHYYILKDRNEERKCWIVEFWFDGNDKAKYESLDSHKYFLSLLSGVVEETYKTIETDMQR